MCNVSVFSVQGAEGLEKVLATATLAPVPWGWEVEGQTAFWTWSPVTQSVLYQLSFSQCFHGCRRFLWCYWMFFISFGTCILSCLHFIGSNTFLNHIIVCANTLVAASHSTCPSSPIYWLQNNLLNFPLLRGKGQIPSLSPCILLAIAWVGVANVTSMYYLVNQ